MSADPDAPDSTNRAATSPQASPSQPTAASTSGSAAMSGSASASGLFERVLVVTGDDGAGKAAVDAGLDVADAHGATVDALFVVDTTEHWDMAVERSERTGETLVEDAAARGEARGVAVDKWFRYGAAHDEVLDFAAAHDADLIVVGSTRRTGLDRLVHPETLPVRVQRGASAPVLVVGADD